MRCAYFQAHPNYIVSHSIPFHSIPFHSITLHYTTLHYTTLHYTTLHYITLHYNLHLMQCQPQPVHKLKFKFKPGSVPAYLGLSYIGCSTCDEALKNDLQFGPIKRSNPNPNESSKRTSETITSRWLWTSCSTPP